jgi:hypothetical protein
LQTLGEFSSLAGGRLRVSLGRDIAERRTAAVARRTAESWLQPPPKPSGAAPDGRLGRTFQPEVCEMASRPLA